MRSEAVLLRGASGLLVLALLLRLSLWQWDRGRASGRLLHYTYAVEWLLVALVLLGVVLRGRPRSNGPDDPHDVSGRLLGPPLRPGEELPPTTREVLLGRRRRGRG